MTKGSSSFSSVAVLGPGLLGGSIIKATKSRLPKCEIRIWARRLEVLEHPDITKAATIASTDIEEVVEGAELIILALPIQHMKSLVEQFPALGPGVVVTDVGSTKLSVVNQLTPMIADLGATFIGSHPMAGSEKTGIDNASKGLFKDAAVVLTSAVDGDQAEQVERLQNYWSDLGGKVFFTEPDRHDEVVAAISHLPHLLAAALVRCALCERDDEMFTNLVGSGFQDTSRIAGGDPDMWTGIMMSNQIPLLDELGKLIEELEQWKQVLATLDKEQLHRFLSEAKDCRNNLEKPT